jgi:O-antigen/teichoic acid export membrane protein
LLVVYWALKLGLRRGAGSKRSAKLDMNLLSPELKFGAIVLIGSLLMTLQYSMDTLVVKHYFDAHTAGLYAGVASVARIVFFVTASITQVLMPSVRLGGDDNRNRQLLFKSLLLMLGVGVPLLGLFVLAPRFVLQLLMGAKFTGVAHVLPLLSVTIFTVSVLNLFISYCLALRRYMVAVVVLLGAALTYTLMVLNHASLSAVVSNMLIGSAAMIAALATWLVLPKASNKEEVVWQTR